jgi:hypothetical protein
MLIPESLRVARVGESVLLIRIPLQMRVTVTKLFSQESLCPEKIKASLAGRVRSKVKSVSMPATVSFDSDFWVIRGVTYPSLRVAGQGAEAAVVTAHGACTARLGRVDGVRGIEVGNYTLNLWVETVKRGGLCGLYRVVRVRNSAGVFSQQSVNV